MGIPIKRAVKEITPPLLMRIASRVKPAASLRRSSGTEHGEKGPGWYDAAFESNPHWKAHYTEVDYYFLWAVIVDRMIREDVRSVLDIGCGAGQLACLIRDKGIEQYYGLDFSEKRVSQARRVCPEYQFAVEDVFKTEALNNFEYDAAICTEVLEHVENDTEIIHKLITGTRFYGTVPNFPWVSHVRHFPSAQAVTERYSDCFTELRVDTFLANPKGKTFYMMDGIVA